MTRFILAVHCHQPVDNFGWVLEEAYTSAYRPFVDVLERHPAVRVVFHYSGPLLDWFGLKHPEFLERLKKLVRRGQAEFLGGGYYEPILAMIPNRDALGQLEQMRQKLVHCGLAEKGEAARGVWLAERVWEPQLPSLLAQAGVRYTIVDDYHLQLAGIPEEKRFGYYLTEDKGSCVALFPSSKILRYLVPFKPVEKVIEQLRGLSSEDNQVMVLADDGEKFGHWPGTHKWVYEEGWLESFFHQLEHSADWLKLTTFRESLAAVPPMGRVYLPCASYEEMLEWSHGSFRNFLIKYPEADAMHKKALWVSERLQEVSANAKSASSHRLLSQARRHLYMGQGNDAYWHGVFGGLYLRHLRRGVYHHLLKAEQLVEASEKKKTEVQAEQKDFDADQAPEFLLRSSSTTLLVDANQGGHLLEWSDKGVGINLLDTLARRPEPYHQRIRSPELVASSAVSAHGPATIHEQVEFSRPDLADLLVYDPCRRAALMDHLLSPLTQVQAFARGAADELGDFLDGAYEGRLKRSSGKVEVVLSRRGRITAEGVSSPLTITKRISIQRGSRLIEVAYRVANPTDRTQDLLFGVEWNIGLKDAQVNRIGEADSVRRFEVVDPALRLRISWAFSRTSRLWYFPIETVSDSERGVERTYQGASVTYLWPLHLSPRSSWAVNGTFQMESVDEKAAAA